MSSRESALLESRKQNKILWLTVTAPWDQSTPATSAPAAPFRAEKEFVRCQIDATEDPVTDEFVQNLLARLGKGGGWPAHVFFTPEFTPIIGGAGFDHPGLEDLTSQLSQAWLLDPEFIRTQASQTWAQFRDQAPHFLPWPQISDAKSALAPELFSRFVTPLEQSLDFETALLGEGDPKFLQPQIYGVLLESPTTRSWAEASLATLVKGSISDPIGGGFFRSTGSYEKVLSQNAEMLSLLESASSGLRLGPLFKKAAGDCVKFLADEFFEKSGPILPAALSDVPSFYEFGPSDLLECLAGNERRVAQLFFGIEKSRSRPVLATDVPTLAEFTNLPPLDVQNMVAAIQHQLREHRKLRLKSKPELAPRAVGSQPDFVATALALRSIVGIEPSYGIRLSKLLWRDIHGGNVKPRNAREGFALSLWALDQFELGAQDSDSLVPTREKLLGLLDSWMGTLENLPQTISTFSIESAGNTLTFKDAGDYLGPSALGLGLEAWFERIRVLDESLTNKTLFEKRLCEALAFVRPLGLFGASTYKVFARWLVQNPTC